MTKKQLISKIDKILRQYQFYKNGLVWNRNNPEYIDVIDLQISKWKDMFTINAGVADKFVIHACWGMDDSNVVEEPLCTVRKRLGELLQGRDMWWGVSDDDGIEKVLSGIQDVAISFLQFNHSIDHMMETLENDPASRRYPPKGIYLALLYHRKGDIDRCMEILKSMKLTGAWSQKTTDILTALN